MRAVDKFSPSALREQLQRSTSHRVLRMVQNIIVVGICVYLVLRILELGWNDVLYALPSTPWFYALFFLRFLTLPASEVIIYSAIWNRRLGRHFAVFLQKRIYNFGIVDYVGEGYFYWWAKRQLSLPDSQVFSTVKDVNILSALAGNMSTLGLLTMLAFSGLLADLNTHLPSAWNYIVTIIAFSIVFCALVIQFRHRIMPSLSVVLGWWVFGVHTARLAIVLILQAAQWFVVVPNVSLATWLLFLSIYMIVSRFPLVPNKELVFLGVGLSLIDVVAAPHTVVSAMFLANAALFHGTNFVFFLFTAMPNPFSTMRQQGR